MPERVLYPPTAEIHSSFIVERLGRDEALQLAPAILGLIVRAYSGQFEGDGKPLPLGAFAAKYDTDVAVQRFQADVIPGAYEQGGAYFGVRDPEARMSLMSVLKVALGNTIKTAEHDRRFAGMLLIDEVLVDPACQRRGYGAALLHAYFRYHADHEARIVLEAIDGSSVNAWYMRLGFQPERPSGELRLNDHDVLSLHYYVTPENIMAATIVRRLEDRYPNLAAGRAS